MLEPQEDEFTADPIFASYDDAVAWLDGNGDSDVDNGFDTLTHTNTIDLTELQDSDAEDCGPSHVYILPASSETSYNSPPASSQSYFDRFLGFKADPTASFDMEFDRYMALQGIGFGSRAYLRERTRAISHELQYHYSQPDLYNATPSGMVSMDDGYFTRVIRRGLGAGLSSQSPEFRLVVYQNMCRQVDLEPRDTIEDCTYDLKHKVLVNIPDFIDAQRFKKKPDTWDDFEDFSNHCIQPGKCIDLEVAKNDEFLKVLLQKLRPTKRPSHSRPSRTLSSLLMMEKRKVLPDRFELKMAVTKRLRPDVAVDSLRVVFGP